MALRLRTMPLRWAAIGCSIFMASMTTIWSPSLTSSPSTTLTLMIVPCIGQATELPVAAARRPARLRRVGR